MIIESHKVDTAAQRSYIKTESEKTQATTWGWGVQKQVSTEKQAVYTEFSQTAQQMLSSDANGSTESSFAEQQTLINAETTTSVGEVVPTVRDQYEMKLEMLRQFVYQLTGKQINVISAETGMQRASRFRFGGLVVLGGLPGGEITHQKTSFESESVSFAAKGQVKTTDGKTIDIDMHLNMSRQFYESSSTTIKWGAPNRQLCDPLVFQFGGSAASLTQRKYSFDLDADGKADQISFAGPGSGFLTLDKNGDGKVNNGSELFGPQTGNGFDELRAFDTDKNGWIDEKDDVFAKLKIWSKDEYGNDQLFTLQELGIGAVYLGETETKFQMNDRTGNMQGQMRSTSFYLKENGSAGYLHQIDLLA